jgi:hypothetical protein
MSKEIKNSTRLEAIPQLAGEVVFLPSPNHRRVKSKFWTRFDSLTGSVSSVSMQQAMGITGESNLKKWWDQPGFKEWFLNMDESRERLEYLFMIALDAAEQVLLDPEANANAKVNLIKVLAQLAGKEPNKQEQFIDMRIQKMGPDQLKEFIMSRTEKLNKSETE